MDEITWKYRARGGGNRSAYKFSLENLKGQDHVEDVCMNEKIMLNVF